MRFADLTGNEWAAARVRQLIDDERLPHALLLYGPAGVPKLALARAAAQYLHCTNRTPDGEPCGHCPACRQHESHNHTDTFFTFPYLKKGEQTVCDDFAAEWNTFLDEHPVEDYEAWLTLLKNDNSQPQIFVREAEAIVRKMSMSAFTSRFKVHIIWLAEKMTEETANKLLKLIEEPYDDCKFILVSDNVKGILPTIYSRVQRIELKKPSSQQVADYLVARYGIDPQDALAVAGPADGNVPMAEQMLANNSEQKAFHDQFVALMRLAYQRDLAQLRNWADTVADYKREKSRRFLTYAARQVRENYIYNLHCPSLNYLTRDEEKFSTRFAPFINSANVEALLNEFSRAERDIQGNGNARIVLFDMAVRVTILIKH